MLVTESGIVILVKLARSLNALSRMLVTPSERVTDFTFGKQFTPIVGIPPKNVTLSKLLLNALAPILFTNAGIIIDVKPVQPGNAPAILVTESGIIKLVKPEQLPNDQLPMLSNPLDKVMLIKPEQLPNAPSPMLVTAAGIVTLVKPVQPAND